MSAKALSSRGHVHRCWESGLQCLRETRLNHERQDLLGERQLPLAAAPLGEDRDVAQARLRDHLLLMKGPEHRPLCQAQPSGLNTFFSSSRSHTLGGHSPPGPTPAGRPQAAPAHPPKASLWSLLFIQTCWGYRSSAPKGTQGGQTRPTTMMSLLFSSSVASDPL